VSDLPWLGLFVWATIAGLDQVSVLQGLLSRPLVAGTVAGAIIGDLESGVRIGAVLELFALDVLPVGAARYPDYGGATVAAVALASGGSWQLMLGPAALLGLIVASLGGWSLVMHRRITAWALHRQSAALDRGEPGVARRVHGLGLLFDLCRSGIMAAVGLSGVVLLRTLGPPLDVPTARALALVVIIGGLAAMVGGALRRAGTLRRFGWLLGGALAGLAGTMLR
jgi:PTS system mannose-specific IIC component